MTTKAFEDFEVGERWVSPEMTITEEDIIGFARDNDPQPIHTDPETAAKGRFGGVIASGWHVATLAMRLFLASGGYGKTPMVGLGVDELRWRRPVRPGDRLHVERELIEKRRSESRPDFGVLRARVAVVNQDGDTVMSMISVGQVPTRG